MLYFNNYKLIIETENFLVFVPDMPHIDRKDGGHVCIGAKNNDIYTLQDFSDMTLFELVMLEKIVGYAMMKILNKHGIDIELLNYQINGNWTFDSLDRPSFHVHIYGRARSAVIQPFGQCLNLPTKSEHPEFYVNNQPLNDDDIISMRNCIRQKYFDARIKRFFELKLF